MDVQGTISSATAAVDWTNIIAGGAFADGMNGELLIRTNVDTRIAVGVADPVASTTAGSAVAAGHASKVILGDEAAIQSIWVQTPADQSPVVVEVDDQGIDVVFVVTA